MTLNLGGNKIWLYAGNSCKTFSTNQFIDGKNLNGRDNPQETKVLNI
jgi:hypothetical protein